MKQMIFTSVLGVALLSAGCGDELPGPAESGLELVLVRGNRQVGRCYAELPVPVTVAVRDSTSGSSMPGYAVDFHVVQGSGSVQQGTVIADRLGLAAAYWTLGAPGPQVLEARATEAGGMREAVARFTATADDREIGGTRVTTSSSGKFTPAISGDRIVWWDKRSGNDDIYLYDLATTTERRITTDPATQRLPDISGDHVVWQDWRESYPQVVYIYDIAVGAERRLTTGSANQGAPAISDDLIVWADERNGGSIYLYDLVTETERQIAQAAQPLGRPDVSGRRVVWLDTRHATAGVWPPRLDIYLYDLTIESERRITTDVAQVAFYRTAQPAISGDRIVWHDERNGNSDVYLYDLAVQTERRVTTDPSDQIWPDVSGDRIVWMDFQNGEPNIYMLDLSTGTERRMSAGSGGQLSPAISGDRIVWTDSLAYIHLHDLSRSCAPPSR